MLGKHSHADFKYCLAAVDSGLKKKFIMLPIPAVHKAEETFYSKHQKNQHVSASYNFQTSTSGKQLNTLAKKT